MSLGNEEEVGHPLRPDNPPSRPRSSRKLGATQTSGGIIFHCGSWKLVLQGTAYNRVRVRLNG